MADFALIYGVSTVSASRGYRNPNHKHHNVHRTAYGLDTEGKFKTKKVGRIEAFRLRAIKVHSLTLVCTSCSRKFTVQARKSAVKAYICARCTDSKDE